MIKEFLLKRAGEMSTWRGIVAFLTACGITLRPDQAEMVIATGLALSGLIGTFLPDVKKKS